MKDITINALANYCLQVKTGKPCAMTSLHERDEKEAVDYIKDQGLLCFSEENEYDFLIFWIYKDEQMLDIIKNTPDKPESKYDHWVLGNLFGYSHESIMEFLNEKC